MSNQIASADTQTLWAVIEDSPGVFKAPAATDAVLVTENMTIKQEREFLENRQRMPSLSKAGTIAGVYNAGEWSAKCYIQPSGAAGTAPVPGQLLKALMGRETVEAGAQVSYSPAKLGDAMPTVSLIAVRGWDTYYISGAVVAKGSMAVKASGDDALLQCTFSGSFLRMRLAGTDSLTAAATVGATALKVADGRRYDVGAFVVVGTDDNAGKGYAITAIDITTNTLTVSVGLVTAQELGATVRGWVPAVVRVPNYVHGRFGVARASTDGGTSYGDLYITEASVEIDTGREILNDEKTGDAYPRSFRLQGRRDVAVNLTRYFYADDSARRYAADHQVSYTLELPVGDVPGKRVMIACPNWQHTTPEMSGDAEMSVALNGKAYATAAMDDEIKIIFN